MSEMTLKPNEKLDVRNILKDLDKYEPKRRGWTWRKPAPNLEMGPFTYHDVSEPLKQSVGLPPAKYFGDIDPQPLPVITTEIASGRFEDDIRRMRMAAWHGADHIMVIRHMGQSHIDGLMEGTPQGIGGVPITRKQVRAQRKALDLIEEEVGRPINYHSYVSGVAGPDVAVMFAEEGINGAHQDPQYNVLYRDINCVRSFVDACESKSIMAWAGMLQIDGAHNANATAREAWKVMPELIVQHAINSLFSERVGMKPENISLSTVPPTATPAPCVYTDLPYAVALRDICGRYKMRAQQNTKYICSSTREATVTHVLNMLISKLTSADIQSTITPDEGRNVPWHIYNIEAIDNAKQTLIGLDGLMEMVELKKDGPLREMARELKERACLFMEEIVEVGGYFNAVQEGFFVDSAKYPERNGDGIARKIEGGVGYGYIFERAEDYMAPVTAHYGYNNVEQYGGDPANPSALIGGCTFEDRSKIVYIDELDEEDNVNVRLDKVKKYLDGEAIKPEVEWCADGTILLTMCIPAEKRVAEAAALEIGKRLAVVPSWQEYDTDRVKLVLDPGLAFGTGGHETTSLCMEALDERVQGGERVLDIGTGSGILAIAALKLGAAVAEGVDIDPVAVRTAGENAALNGVQDQLTVLVGDLSDKASGQYNIITANIVANAILSLAPAVPGLMADGATFIASGIIDTRKDEVIAGLEAAGLAVVEVKEKRGWECIVCKKA